MPNDDKKPLSPEDILYVQGSVGTLLFYARSIDITMLFALDNKEEYQANGKISTTEAFKWILDYCNTHPNEKLRYKASDTRLKIHYDTLYL